MKKHPVTGEDVPDDTARVPVVKYINPRKAEWPKAEYIVGNPPFIGNSRMRHALGDGYAECIRQTYNRLPETCDFVMYWWDRAAEFTSDNQVNRFGFITTNSIRQKFSRRILEQYINGPVAALSLIFAIPDHPWVDSSDGAAVRIAMTVAAPGTKVGRLNNVASESIGVDDVAEVNLRERIGRIQTDLTIGANVAGTLTLKATQGLSCPGVKLHGAGFIVSPEEARHLGLGSVPGLELHIRQYRNGRDLTASPREVMVIDLFGLGVDELRQRFPAVYQHVHDHVKPERDQNNRAVYRDSWWMFGEPRAAFRPSLKGLARYIATVETAKHRVFQFLDASILPDNMLVVIALNESLHLGVLSSRIHIVWSLAAGGTLEDRPRYNKSRCFEPFPFPEMPNPRTPRIRELGEQLDAHRKRQQAAHPDLTLTGMYNVLEKLRSGELLTAKEKVIHEQGLVSVLKQIHDDLDAAVFEAYGWPVTLTDEEILERLVALNAERAEEEKRGLIRWLRPEFQNPSGGQAIQPELELELETEAEDEEETAAATTKKGGKAKKGAGKTAPGGKTKAPAKQPWPTKLSEQVQALIQKLQTADSPLTAQELAKAFTRANADTIDELLETLVAIGKARQVGDDKFTAV